MTSASDTNSQLLTSATKAIGSGATDSSFVATGEDPVLVLKPGEALYAIASAANRIVVNVSYKTERG